MRLPTALLLAAAVLLGSTAQAKPKAVISLPRADKWIVQYDDNACHLFARFGSEQDGIIMKLTRYNPGDGFELWFYGKPLSASGRDIRMTLDFGVSDKPIKRDALAGKAGDLPSIYAGGMRIDDLRSPNGEILPAVTTQQEAAATALTIGVRGKLYRLETGPLDRPFAKLRECQTDLVKSWGYDPAVQAQLSRPPVPRGNPGYWATSDDFPVSALANGKSGLVKFRLDINETGAVTNCVVLEQTNPIEFGKTSCKILIRRGKFEPALDKDGKPVRSFWVSSIRWLA